MRTWSIYQLEVFKNIASGVGHTAVQAVAGSGKTTTIVEGLKHVPAGCSTTFMAFNTKIADELKKRAPYGVDVRSLHSYGNQAVVRRFGRLPVNKYRVDDMARLLSPEINKNIDLRRDLSDCVSKCKGMLASTDDEIDAIIDQFGYDSATNGDRASFIATVQQLLHQCTGTEDGCIDYDDQIWLPLVLDLKQRQFDRVFVDETQDLNAAQIALVLRAVKPGGRIMAVGDPRQAIYAFRGADARAFENVVGRLNATVLPLSVCYRCCKAVVREAQLVVPEIQAAPDAEEGEVRSVEYAEMRKAVQPGDFVLSRTNAPLVSLCMALLAEGRPAIIQGRDVGAQLAGLVRKSKAADVEALRDYIEAWMQKECARLIKKNRDTQMVEDKAACILAISEGAASVADVLARIEALFVNTNDASRIVLSSTHKAKGLERDRVWLLGNTYRRRPGVEEDNLWYVAVTRARKLLVIVEGLS
jgi:DNA helicase II / ATP-dependent DNA helicase PcrA